MPARFRRATRRDPRSSHPRLGRPGQRAEAARPRPEALLHPTPRGAPPVRTSETHCARVPRLPIGGSASRTAASAAEHVLARYVHLRCLYTEGHSDSSRTTEKQPSIPSVGAACSAKLKSSPSAADIFTQLRTKSGRSQRADVGPTSIPVRRRRTQMKNY